MVVSAGGAFSLWVHLRLPQWELGQASRPVVLVALPLVALCTVAGVRLIAGPTGRGGDLVLTWLMAFLAGMHGVLLAVGVGILDDVLVAVPAITGLLFCTLGLVVAQLEPGSAMGIRVRSTLDDDQIWRRTHRRLGKLLAIAGGLGLLAAPFSPVVAMAAIVIGAPAALLVSILTAARSAGSVEHSGPAARQTSDDGAEAAPQPGDKTGAG